MINNRDFVKDLMSNIVFFLLFYSLLNSAYTLIYQDTNVLLPAVFVPFILLLFVRQKVQNAAVFAALHIALFGVAAGLALAYSTTETGLFAVIFLFFTGVYSVFAFLRGEWRLRIPSALVLLVIYFSLYAGTADGRLIILFIVSLVLIVFYSHMDNLDFRLTLLKQSDQYDHPSKRILSSNNTLISVFVLLLAVFAVGAVFMPANLIASGALGVFGFLIRPIAFIISRFAYLIARILAFFFDFRELELDGREENVDLGDGELELGENEPMLIVGYIIAFIFVIFILWVITRFIGLVRRAGPRVERDAATEVVRLDKTFVSDLLDLLPRIDRQHRHPIRRAYEKKVNSFIRKGVVVLGNDTTDIIADKIRPEENIDELTDKYERVRYGKSE